MAHILLDESIPGIRSLLAFYPAIAHALKGLMETMMRSDEGLNKGERELIASLVSRHNHCPACENIHGAVARHLLGWKDPEFELALRDPQSLSPRLKTLLALALLVARNAKQETGHQVSKARSLGCTDREIHDTVLIAAAFCMFNRYMDGLGLIGQDTAASVNERGRYLAEHGYGG